MRDIKGIILAGGTASRLKPLTNIHNKHLLPVYNKLMIHYPIRTLVQSGIKDILIVCGGNCAGDFLRVLGNGEDFGLKHIAYTYQKESGGIAHALSLAEEWAGGSPVCVVLGDNILENPIIEHVGEFKKHPHGARIFVTEVERPEWYGVVEIDRTNGSIIRIVEKPKKPKSNLIAIGLYMYDSTVWDYIRSLKPSKRNELEITDLNNRYLKMGGLAACKIKGYWGDAGESINTYLDTCLKVRELGMNGF